MSRLRCLGTIYSRSHFKCLVSPVYDSYKTKNYSHVTGTPMARALPNHLAFSSQFGHVLLLLFLFLFAFCFVVLLLLLLLLSVIKTREGKLGQH